MTVILVILHITVSIFLILVVLLQVGKGQSLGAAFGGGASQTLFGSRGPATFLSRLTTIAAAVFMLTSLTLAYLSSHARQRSTITEQAPLTESAPQPMQPVQGSGSASSPQTGGQESR